MKPDVSIRYYKSLDNLYAYHGHCHHKSVEAFNVAITKQQFPSRINLLYLGLLDAVTTPLSIAIKICEIALFIWNFVNLKTQDGSASFLSYLPSMISLLAIQLSLPFICTALRISASIAGLFIPKFALEGWKIAEAGEEHAYMLWAMQHQELSVGISDRVFCEEISPTNAIHYLGLAQTRQNLEQKTDVQKRIETEILLQFNHLLQYLLHANSSCFQALLFYHEAIKLPSMSQNVKSTYFLTDEIREILNSLIHKQVNKAYPVERLQVQAGIDPTIDPILIDRIFVQLSIEKLERLFVHIQLNLQACLIWDGLNLDSKMTDHYFTHLSDLFSLRLQFGRAHFKHGSCHPRIRV